MPGNWGEQRWIRSNVIYKRSKWINLDKAKAWVDFCNSHHGSHCQSSIPPSDKPFSQPVWLIDVEANCLFSTDNSRPVPYAAMSYVWGQRAGDDVLQTTRDNLSVFLQDGAFSKPEVESRIPDDVHVAVHITRALGLKYLWCDRFCITQDDEVSKKEQIANMASIYAHSNVTIVCTAHTPRGLNFKQGAKPRNKKLSRDNLHIWRNHKFNLEKSVWNSRGWTLQELVFSQRAIFVHKESITWQCHCIIQDEYSKFIHAPCDWRVSNITRGLHFSSWPDLKEYSQLVSDYSRRALTFEDDVLRAFSGITNTLSMVFIGGFHFGLPRLFFDTAMLWQAGDRLTRRNGNSFPSWSWVGWIGKIDVANWEMGSNYVLDRRSRGRNTSNEIGAYCRVIPTVPWAVAGATVKQPSADSPQASAAQQVSLQNLMDNDTSSQERSMDGKSYRPQWTKIGDCWSHPCDNLKKFRYPIPVASDFSSRITELPTSLHYLNAASTTARLWCEIGDVSDDSGSSDIDPNSDEAWSFAWANIYKSQGREPSTSIGSLMLDGNGIGDSAACSEGAYLDFVAISEGYAKDENDFGKRKFVRFVFVLWVEKVGGVLYRRGLGRVYRNAWLECAKHEDVVLG